MHPSLVKYAHQSLEEPSTLTYHSMEGDSKFKTHIQTVIYPKLESQRFHVNMADIGIWNNESENFKSWNHTDYNELEVGDRSLVLAVTIGIVLGAISTVTITGNTLVLLGAIVNPSLRSTTHYFIANLAVADLMVGVVILPFSASLEVLNFWPFGSLLCDVWAAADVLCCTASILSLCVISMDRYIGVTRPLRHSIIFSTRRVVGIILIVWFASLAISVAPLLGWKQPPNGDPYNCEVTKQLGYVLFSVSGSFYVPMTIILMVYWKVYRAAVRQSRSLITGVKILQKKSKRLRPEQNDVTLRIHTGKGQQLQGNSPSRSCSQSKISLSNKIARFQREKKAAKTLGIVVGVFILCWFPFFFVLPLEALCGTACSPPEWLFKIIFWLGYCNSMMNPIIYACSSQEYKRTFHTILRCCCCPGRTRGRQARMAGHHRGTLVRWGTSRLASPYRDGSSESGRESSDLIRESFSLGERPTRESRSVKECGHFGRKNGANCRNSTKVVLNGIKTKNSDSRSRPNMPKRPSILLSTRRCNGLSLSSNASIIKSKSDNAGWLLGCYQGRKSNSNNEREEKKVENFEIQMNTIIIDAASDDITEDESGTVHEPSINEEEETV